MRRRVGTILILILLIIVGSYIRNEVFGPPHQKNKAVDNVKKVADIAEMKNGDLIFQTSVSRQSKAIQQATHSKYSHCGIVYKDGADYFVYEAIEPVRLTPLKEWIARGAEGHFAIRRLKDAEKVLTPSVLNKMRIVGDRFKGKHYDLYFDWTDDRIYCSELIWKVYKEATGLELGKLAQLKDFDLSSVAVKEKMKERYGSKIPMNETVISPESIYNSELLETVKLN
ncbi:YiiX family permuted papain-like enzyme [Pedobacter caeni]|uniref:Permuted papain-like amidase enzyme, YaeF/YiiX, C92 family n=1 Tax=Pedobacter caeni TaxID=288992 RepID=A0A1M5E8V5_9SPHI|nr:YiiX family permuted papain-like enzyme [Pedobacter caeni]SHF75703.1 Permuted papain-like amidase enzyme, YaeF/YiiX, C92 family [Pedobacter caeni]